MDDQVNYKSMIHSSFFWQLANKHLPSDDVQETARPIGSTEYILWMIGITAGLFLLRAAYCYVFQ
jgi:hypothetical protein